MRDWRPDLVLMDWTLPGLDGFDLLAEKQADPDLADIPVILLTANDCVAETPPPTQFTIRHQDGFYPVETLSFLGAAVQNLKPRFFAPVQEG